MHKRRDDGPARAARATEGAVLCGPLAATALTVAIVAAAFFLAHFVVSLLREPSPLATSDGAASAASSISDLALIAWQVAAIVLVLQAAARPGGRALVNLGLDRWPRRSEIVIAVAGLIALAVPYDLLVFAFARDAAIGDLRPFAESLAGPRPWLLAIAACVGAPIAEEMLFRGFLLPALARSRLGFAGAALVATAGWTALHAAYSIYGLAEVMLVGLYLSFVYQRSRCLWVAIIAHAAYNTSLLAFLALVGLPA